MSMAASISRPANRSGAGLSGAFGRVCIWVLLACGIAVIFVPLLLTVALSVFDEKLILFPPRGYTLAWYGAILPNFGDAIAITLELAAASVVGSLLLGVPAGIALSRHRGPVVGVVSALLLAPLTVPGIALGLSIYLFLVLIEIATGWPLTGSTFGLVLAHLLVTMPWAVRLSLAGLTNHDRAAEEAATSLGAAPLSVIWRVTLPAMRQGIIAAGLFAFIFSFSNLEMALFLVAPGVTTLPVAVLQYLEYHVDPLVAAVAVAQMLLVGAMLVALDRFVRLGQVVR
ncbi:MAG TPA: ABC transporter permease [Stellaceae bacterium]|jgi:putative spermidine/putrescine transport system permease protein|nr:ABC transporter permease [Stellaceae bacterium]